ncbi:hypothetical protein JCM19298_417 [Nonlabens ulvanivorans]|nr:hypothetical protein JCM19298_417 [Nonlabens ulvanivorans]
MELGENSAPKKRLKIELVVKLIGLDTAPVVLSNEVKNALLAPPAEVLISFDPSGELFNIPRRSERILVKDNCEVTTPLVRIKPEVNL